MSASSSATSAICWKELFRNQYAWAGVFMTVLAMATLVTGFFLKGLAPLALVVLTGLLVVCPFLLRLERQLFWAWFIAFPILYYSPVRTAITDSGSTDVLIPLFILASLPGMTMSFFTQMKYHRALMPLTLPLWFMLVGLTLNILHVKELFKPVSWAKSTMEMAALLYLMVIAFRLMQENPRQPIRMLHVLIGFGFANSVMLILQSIFHFGLVSAGGFMRPTGLFGFPISSSFMALITLNMAFYRFFRSDNKRERQLLLIAAVTIILSCVMSLSKTSMLQVLPLLALWSTMIPRRALKKVALSGGAVVLGFLMILVFYNEGSLLHQLLGRFSRTDTLDIRQQAWGIVWGDMTWETMLWGRGWLSGTELLGIHNYNYGLFPVDLASPAGAMAIHPHNAYLKYTYEMGLWGIGMLVSYIALMLLAFLRTLQKAHRQKRYENLAIGGFIFVLLFASSTTSPMAEHYTLLFVSMSLLIVAYQAGWFRGPLRENLWPNAAELPSGMGRGSEM